MSKREPLIREALSEQEEKERGKKLLLPLLSREGVGKLCVCVVAAVKTPLASIPAECAALLYYLFVGVLLKKGQEGGETAFRRKPL